MSIEWLDPPPEREATHVEVKRVLAERPGHWARIVRAAPLISLMAWWGPLLSDPQIEVKYVHVNIHGERRRDIYARFTNNTEGATP